MPRIAKRQNGGDSYFKIFGFGGSGPRVKTLHVTIWISGKTSNFRNFTAFPIRFWNTWVRCVGSANTVVTPQNLSEIPSDVKYFQKLSTCDINLIRPKQDLCGNDWFAHHTLTSQNLQDLQRTCKVLVHKYSPTIRFTVDSSLALLMMDQIHQDINAYLLPGCGAGTTFCYVDPNLSLYPCSHLVRGEFYAGNLSTTSFLEVWAEC